MNMYSIVLMTIIFVLVLITVISLIVSYISFFVKKPVQKWKGTVAFLTAIGGIYNIFDLLNKYK